MKVITPDYFPQFSCIAAACPDTCCAGWEVVVDPAAEARYRALATPLGDRLRAAMGEDGGDCVFTPREDGRCPFLNRDNLCDIQAELGEEALCRTCRLYPRFINDFGGVREMGLSLSCPEAARIILSAPPLPHFRMEDRPELPPDLNDLDAGQYFAVKAVRDKVMALLSFGSLDERLALSLRLCRKAEKQLRKGAPEKAEALCAALHPEEDLKKESSRAADRPPLSAGTVLRALEKCLILRDSWRARLKKAARPDGKLPPLDPSFERRIAELLSFRYLLKAAYDGRLSARMKFIAFSVLSLRALGQGMDEKSLQTLIVNYSREVEHCEENMASLLQKFDGGGKFSSKAFVSQLLLPAGQLKG